MIDEDNYNIKVNVFGNENDLKVNSDYNSFRKNICHLVNIPPEYFNKLLISYYDEDGDNIQLVTEEDYEICFQQIKEGKVDKMMLEINEELKNDSIKNLENSGDHQVPGQDSQNINDINIHNDINNNNFNNINENNNDYINNINVNNVNKINIFNDDNKNYFDINDYENNNIDHHFNNKNDNKNEVIFELECSYCKIKPIFSIVYYCPGCKLYSCEECAKKIDQTKHNIYVIESKEQLINVQNEVKNEEEINRIVIKDIQNKDKEEIEKNKKALEKIKKDEQQRNYHKKHNPNRFNHNNGNFPNFYHHNNQNIPNNPYYNNMNYNPNNQNFRNHHHPYYNYNPNNYYQCQNDYEYNHPDDCNCEYYNDPCVLF